MSDPYVEISQTVTGDKNIVTGTGDITIVHPSPLSPDEARTRANLRILIESVKVTWIKGVLEDSVHDSVLLDLGKEKQVDVIDHPWSRVLEWPDRNRQALPPERRIIDIFDEANRLLLILGEPGSGKTITLLELARALLLRAERAIEKATEDFDEPIPVVFNLSTWTDRRKPLLDWLVDELSSKYRTPRRMGYLWLRNRRLLPLLDGLDEVKRENQSACVKEINTFIEAHGPPGLAACSRTETYLGLAARLKFYGAIHLRPLTSDQIKQYLSMADGRLDVLSVALESDPALQSLARSPLMLSIMGLAYQEIPPQSLYNQTLDTVEKRRTHLLDTYIDRMLKRRGRTSLLSDNQQTKKWLSWLAQQMASHNQSIFLMEQLQPSWLPDSSWRWPYALVSRLISGLMLGLSTIPVMGMVIRGITVGLLGGLSIGVVSALQFEQGGYIPPQRAQKLTRAVISVLIVGVATGAANSLLGGHLIDSLILGLIFGLTFGLRSGKQSLTNDIQTIEAVSWRWGRAIIGTALGLGLGLISRIGIGLVRGVVLLSRGVPEGFVPELVDGALTGLNIGLILGPIGAMFGGLGNKIIETRAVPNQGIRLSTQNAARAGLIFGLIIGMVFGLASERAARLNQGLHFGLTAGLCAALWYGGLDVIQHKTLYLILTLQNHVPHKYSIFLDDAVSKALLQRVGGGYGFSHRLLLEHFATMGNNDRRT